MMERYNQHREKLIAARSEVAQKTAGLDEIAVERNADPLDDLQRATERDLVITRLDHDRERLRAIDAALRRIANGDYGVCEDCGEPISAKRLNALPWAPLCIACQGRADAERIAEDPRYGHLSDAA